MKGPAATALTKCLSDERREETAGAGWASQGPRLKSRKSGCGGGGAGARGGGPAPPPPADLGPLCHHCRVDRSCDLFFLFFFLPLSKFFSSWNILYSPSFEAFIKVVLFCFFVLALKTGIRTSQIFLYQWKKLLLFSKMMSFPMSFMVPAILLELVSRKFKQMLIIILLLIFIIINIIILYIFFALL